MGKSARASLVAGNNRLNKLQFTARPRIEIHCLLYRRLDEESAN